MGGSWRFIGRCGIGERVSGVPGARAEYISGPEMELCRVATNEHTERDNFPGIRVAPAPPGLDRFAKHWDL